MNNIEIDNLIISKIKAVLPDAQIELNTEDGLHYQARVASAQFAELKKLEQHRLVMNALSEVISSNLVHAVQLKTEAL